ncbi:inositol monophosphatase family protein [Streptococcus entericus]|uniref:inositol monophosphatase family protein n=1 Tax=Streptococcus entericus TaxID=155680 RepID=UPI00037B74BA|nr:inositol monophosphatase family protein [Streptococcus entericus]
MNDKFIFAQQLIRQAGLLIKEQMGIEVKVETKSAATDLVTNVDKACQQFLVESIQDRYPNDHFLAEEDNLKTNPSRGAVWVIDPIDGTVNFVTQQQDFAVMLAYLEDGVGQFGLIYDVMADKLYSGGKGFPVTCNGGALPLVSGGLLNQSLVASNTRLYAQNAYHLADLFNRSLGVRNYGCAGLSMARVLAGQLWGYASYLCPWDYLAAAIMGEELGYLLETLDGSKLDMLSRQSVIFYPAQEQLEVKTILTRQ